MGCFARRWQALREAAAAAEAAAASAPPEPPQPAPRRAVKSTELKADELRS